MGENISKEHYTCDRPRKSSQIPCQKIVQIYRMFKMLLHLLQIKQVLIAYKTDTKDRNLTADQVKKTAMSIVPRYYHVYVSDNTGLRDLMESYSYLDSNSRNAKKGCKVSFRK